MMYPVVPIKKITRHRFTKFPVILCIVTFMETKLQQIIVDKDGFPLTHSSPVYTGIKWVNFWN